MESFDEFVIEIESIFCSDAVHIYEKTRCVDVVLTTSTHCASRDNMKELITLLECYEFEFSIHVDSETEYPDIWIVYGKPRQPKKPLPGIPNDIPIDTRIGC